MIDSIISNEKECFRCGTTLNLHRHHIFGGSRRKISERFGCWVYLCANHHNMTNNGIHFDKAFDTAMKQRCQRKWEQKWGSREDFIRMFGRSYL